VTRQLAREHTPVVFRRVTPGDELTVCDALIRVRGPLIAPARRLVLITRLLVAIDRDLTLLTREQIAIIGPTVTSFGRSIASLRCPISIVRGLLGAMNRMRRSTWGPERLTARRAPLNCRHRDHLSQPRQLNPVSGRAGGDSMPP
jgi:hypothetical protein